MGSESCLKLSLLGIGWIWRLWSFWNGGYLSEFSEKDDVINVHDNDVSMTMIKSDKAK